MMRLEIVDLVLYNTFLLHLYRFPTTTKLEPGVVFQSIGGALALEMLPGK